MILYINTASQKDIEVGLKSGSVFVFKDRFEAERAQAEKLLPAIEKLLQKNKLKLKDIESIEVENTGGSFTSLRIGVATANALAFALGVPVIGLAVENHPQPLLKKEGGVGFDVVAPVYDREPDIGNAKC